MTIGTTRFFGNNSELFSKLNTELQSLQTQAGTGKAELKLANNIGDISKLSAAEEKKSETNQLLSNSQRAQTDLEVMDVAFERLQKITDLLENGNSQRITQVIVSGQMKLETTLTSTPMPLRQLGFQEFNIIDCVSDMTKYAVTIINPELILYHLEKAYFLATSDRKGPVWLDIPLDIQSAKVDLDK